MPVAVRRPDVVSARSRMRTKYGSQRQIAEVAALLAADERLLLMAVAVARTAAATRGLLAVTDRRLVFVPSSDAPPVCTDLASTEQLDWDAAGRSGTLRVRSDATTLSYSGLTNADARDLCTAVGRVHAHLAPPTTPPPPAAG